MIVHFWSKVRIAGDNECWEWQGAKNGKSKLQDYGVVWHGNKRYKAHRFSAELIYGEIPVGLLVCHSCDNPSCVNPSHLFLGTTRDNNSDCIAKGRARKEFGSRRHCAKLTESDVAEIKSQVRMGIKRGFLPRTAERYGVCKTAIFNVVHGLRWKHVA